MRSMQGPGAAQSVAQQPQGPPPVGSQGVGVPMMQAGLPPPAQEVRTGETSVNIAIEEMKNFDPQVAPHRELYTEFTTEDGGMLFECPGILKDTGIDLMDCPLHINLKLRVRRRHPSQNFVLWHVVLPMQVISKHLVNPPHEWQTWIGLLPNNVNLEAHPADVMFTQSVHLISRPEFPKLLLRFKYHNPELQAQMLDKKEREHQEAKQRQEKQSSTGKKVFEDLQKNMDNFFRATSSTGAGNAAPVQEAPPVRSAPAGYPQQHQHSPAPVFQQALALEQQQQQQQQQREGAALLASVVHFASCVRELLAVHPGRGDAAALPPPLEVQTSPMPAQLLDGHCKLLVQRLRATLESAGASDGAGGGSGVELETQLIETLRMSLMGIVADDTDVAKVPRTSTNLSAASADQIASVRGRFPGLWEVYREVSTTSMERSKFKMERDELMQEKSQWLDTTRRLEEALSAQPQAEQSKKHFNKMLAQQRNMQQLSFDKEVGALRHQLAEVDRVAKEKSDEATRLRAELNECRRQLSLERQNAERQNQSI